MKLTKELKTQLDQALKREKELAAVYQELAAKIEEERSKSAKMQQDYEFKLVKLLQEMHKIKMNKAK